MEACASAEVEIMKKLREAFENDMLAVHVSARAAATTSLCASGEDLSLLGSEGLPSRRDVEFPRDPSVNTRGPSGHS